jgi:pyrimidine-specific ribonucleoside hydrolase
MKPEPVLLDVDPGYDDAIAIMLACGAPGLDVRAITTVAGNVAVEKTTRNALKVLTLVERTDVPVGAGAASPLVRKLRTAEHIHGESGLDGADLPEPALPVDGRDAVRLMADVVREAPEPVTIIPLGPLTNVATFLEEHPRLKQNVRRIVLMGGSIGPGNVTPAAEFNVYVDPEAARMVFESGLPLTMVGLDVTREVAVGSEEVERLQALGRAGEIVTGLATYYYAGAYRRIYGLAALPIHDPVAVAAVVEPALLKTRCMRVDVECEGELTRGETVCDLYGVTGRPSNAEVGVGLDKNAFFKVLVRSLEGLGI